MESFFTVNDASSVFGEFLTFFEKKKMATWSELSTASRDAGQTS
jgi:hypothetical protein